MSSILPGYEYDIFISYRQKDNRTGWVSTFVEILRNEIEATFKEDISIYFDENTHDGLTDLHDVDASLKEKIKCLIFIPIVSLTYCDPMAFAWRKEFIAFRDYASADQFGLSIRLPEERQAHRILQVKIHDLDEPDSTLFEHECRGLYDTVDFVFRSIGVNRPLRSVEDDPKRNLYNLIYRDQVNKIANKVKEILYAVQNRSISLKAIPSSSITPHDANARANKSIAVMPFVNIGNDESMEYFSDGLTDELITDLSRITSLRVIANNSMLKYKGSNMSPSEISETLRVSYLLEGSVRFNGNDLRVTTKLIDTKSNSTVWAEKYSGTSNNLFEIQESLSRDIVSSLKIELNSEEHGTLSVRPIENQEAYKLYLQARMELTRMFSPDSYKNVIELMNSCLRINGENELIYGTLVSAYLGLFGTGEQSELYMQEAQKYLSDILRLNPNSEHGHFAKGSIEFQHGKLSEALHSYKKALSINENNIDANIQCAIVLLEAGRPEAAEPYLKKLMELDPLTGTGFGMYGYKEWNQGRFQSALPFFRKGWELDTKEGISYWSYACAMASCGLFDDACLFVDALEDSQKRSVFGKLSLFLKYGLLKQREDALNIVDDELVRASSVHAFIARDMAGYFTLVGEIDTALKYVEKAIQLGYINYPFLAFHHPFYGALRTQARFIEMMDHVKERWESFDT